MISAPAKSVLLKHLLKIEFGVKEAQPGRGITELFVTTSGEFGVDGGRQPPAHEFAHDERKTAAQCDGQNFPCEVPSPQELWICQHNEWISH